MKTDLLSFFQVRLYIYMPMYDPYEQPDKILNVSRGKSLQFNATFHMAFAFVGVSYKVIRDLDL